MTEPAIVVVGPGAMGCLLAARLAEAGEAVLLLDHRPDRAARLAEAGLVLEDARGSRSVRVPVVAELGAGLDVRLAFVCVKARATEAAVGALPAGSYTVAVLQNGLGGCEQAGETLGSPDRIVGVLTVEGATRLGQGHVRHAGRGATQVGALTPAGEGREGEVVALLQAGGFVASGITSLELARQRWEKLGVNAAINALTGLLGCPNGGLLESPSAAALADAAAEEAAEVAAACGVPGEWSSEAARARWRAVAQDTKSNISSTLQDLRNARSTEVYVINGALAEAAREAGCSASVNALLARLIAAREELQEGDR